jgi:hypothetical protein
MTSELPPQTNVVDSIVCPKCDSTLDAMASHCPHCNTSTTDKNAPSADPRLVDRPWLIVIVLLHLGVLGIPLYWCTRYSLKTRLMIVLFSIVYTVFAVGVIIWGIMQILKLFM